MLLMRFLASGVTVSHSGEGYCERGEKLYYESIYVKGEGEGVRLTNIGTP